MPIIFTDDEVTGVMSEFGCSWFGAEGSASIDLNAAVKVDSGIDTNVEGKVSSDLTNRIANQDFKVDKADIQGYAEAGGAIAGVAACTALGVGAAVAPLCGIVGGAVAKFLSGAILDLADSLFGPSDEEIAAEQRKAEVEQHFANQEAVLAMQRQANITLGNVVDRILKSAKKYGVKLNRQDVLTQMGIEGLMLVSPPSAAGQRRDLAAPDWMGKFLKGWKPANIQKDVEKWLAQLQKSSTNAGIKILAFAAGQKAKEAFKNEQGKIQFALNAADSSGKTKKTPTPITTANWWKEKFVLDRLANEGKAEVDKSKVLQATIQFVKNPSCFNLGIGVQQHKEIKPEAILELRRSLKNGAEKESFDMALAVHIGVVNESKNKRVKDMPAGTKAGYYTTMGVKGAGLSQKEGLLKQAGKSTQGLAGIAIAIKQVRESKTWWAKFLKWIGVK